MLRYLFLLLSWLCYTSGCKENSYFQDAGPLVKTLSGSVVGKYIKVFDTDVAAFLGIPFASPPLGEKRFKKADPVEPWKGIMLAHEKPQSCMQSIHRKFPWISTTTPNENCLYLNIWTPTKCCCDHLSKLPVLVWIYGGAFSSGSSNLDVYDGSTIASFGEAIVVSMNYRVGVFGFLDGGSDDYPGNAGLHDQNLAMKWIHENIHFFGGDPNKITLFGESAGAISINLHLISPLSVGLFHRVILQSGAAYGISMIDDLSTARAKTKLYAQLVGCADENTDMANDSLSVIHCLKSKDAMELAKAESTLTSKVPSFFTPTFGNEFLPKSPKEAFESGDITQVDVLTGIMKNEGNTFLNYMLPELFPYDQVPSLTTLEEGRNAIRFLFRMVPEAVVDAIYGHYFQNISDGDGPAIVNAVGESLGDFVFNCPALFSAEKFKTVYMYWMTHRSLKNPSAEWMGATHFDDVPFVFGKPITDSTHFTPEDGRFSGDLIQKWTSFARSGYPLSEGDKITWPKFDSSSPVAYELNPRNRKILLFPRKEACEFWRAIIFASASENRQNGLVKKLL